MGKKYKSVNIEAMLLMKTMLARDPEGRISAESARNHSWFKYDEVE